MKRVYRLLLGCSLLVVVAGAAVLSCDAQDLVKKLEGRFTPAASNTGTDPVSVLRRAAAYTDTLEDATVDLRYHLRLTEGEKVTEQDSTYRILLGEGHNFALAPTGGTFGPRVHAGDGRMVVLSPRQGGRPEEYRVSHGVAAFSGTRAATMIGHGLGGLTLSLLSTPSVEHVLESLANPEEVGVETIRIGKEEVECHRGRVTTFGITWDYWVETGDRPRLRRMVPDLSEEDETKEKAEMTIDFVAWNESSSISEEAFATETPPHAMVGKSLPSAPLPLLNGGTQRLEDLIGKKVIVLDFWATWCPACLLGLPTLEKVTDEYDGRVASIAVNVGEDPEELKTFIDNQGWSLPIALDPKLEINKKWQVGNGLPFSMIIGLDGKVHVADAGVPKDQEVYREKLKEKLDKLLAGEKLGEESLKKWKAMAEAFASTN